MRKFEVVKRINEYSTSEEMVVRLPERSTSKSAGYDFFLPENTVCKAHEITLVKTGMKAYMEDDDVLLLYNRSSNPKKKGLMVANGVGVIDSDYVDNPDNEGEIGVLFRNYEI